MLFCYPVYMPGLSAHKSLAILLVLSLGVYCLTLGAVHSVVEVNKNLSERKRDLGCKKRMSTYSDCVK